MIRSIGLFLKIMYLLDLVIGVVVEFFDFYNSRSIFLLSCVLFNL